MKMGQKRKAGQRSLQRKADLLFSQLVRQRAKNKCEYCGKSGTLHCHHGIVHRRYLNTRYVFDNCACLCVNCHRLLGDFPSLNVEWFTDRIGTERMCELETRAGKHTGKFDYETILRELGGKE